MFIEVEDRDRSVTRFPAQNSRDFHKIDSYIYSTYEHGKYPLIVKLINEYEDDHTDIMCQQILQAKVL